MSSKKPSTAGVLRAERSTPSVLSWGRVEAHLPTFGASAPGAVSASFSRATLFPNVSVNLSGRLLCSVNAKDVRPLWLAISSRMSLIFALFEPTSRVTASTRGPKNMRHRSRFAAVSTFHVSDARLGRMYVAGRCSSSIGKIDGAMFPELSTYPMLFTRAPYTSTRAQSSFSGGFVCSSADRNADAARVSNDSCGADRDRRRTRPRPGLRARLRRVLGNRPRSGVRLSRSRQSTFNAGSWNALQVRARRDTERRPPGVSRMASSSFWVASASRRMAGYIFCW